MLRLGLVSLLLTAQLNYKQDLVHECLVILRKNQECSNMGYDILYKNLTIYSMLDNTIDRYEYIMALRKKCKNKLSRWELGR